MKKTGFSLAELMIFMVFISLVLAATAPMITKRTMDLPSRTSHGMFMCYRDVDNRLHQATFSANTITNDTIVNNCSFTPPSRVAFFKLELIGGGAGGFDFVKRDEGTAVTSGPFYYDPRLSDADLLQEFDNIEDLIPSDEKLFNWHMNKRCDINVYTGRGEASHTTSYNYYPTNVINEKPPGIMCYMNTADGTYVGDNGSLLNDYLYTTRPNQDTPDTNTLEDIEKRTYNLHNYLKDLFPIEENKRYSFSENNVALDFINDLCVSKGLVPDKYYYDHINTEDQKKYQLDDKKAFKNGFYPGTGPGEGTSYKGNFLTNDFFVYRIADRILTKGYGGMGKYITHSFIFNNDNISINNTKNQLREMFTTGYQTGGCDTPGCRDGSFSTDKYPKFHSIDNFFDEEVHILKGDTVPTLGYYDGVDQKYYAAIKTPRGYITNTVKPTGGKSPRVTIDINEQNNNPVFLITETPGVDGIDASGISSSYTLPENSTTISDTDNGSESTPNIKINGRVLAVYLSIDYRLNNRNYNVGNSGYAGEYNRWILSNLPNNCNFNVGFGGDVIGDTNEQDVSTLEKRQDLADTETTNYPRETSLSCPIDGGFEKVYSVRGGSYRPEDTKYQFGPIEQLRDPQDQYSNSGKQDKMLSPLNPNIFLNYNNFDFIAFGQGGNASSFTDTCTAVTGNVYYSYDDLGSVVFPEACYDDETTLTKTHATKGIGGAIIISW